MNEALINRIILMIDNYENKKDEMACLKMLICTISPIVQGMQISLKQYINKGLEPRNPQSTEETAKNMKREKKEESSSFNKFDYLSSNFREFLKYFPTQEKYLEKTVECDKIYSKSCAKYFSLKHLQ